MCFLCFFQLHKGIQFILHFNNFFNSSFFYNVIINAYVNIHENKNMKKYICFLMHETCIMYFGALLVLKIRRSKTCMIKHIAD